MNTVNGQAVRLRQVFPDGRAITLAHDPTQSAPVVTGDVLWDTRLALALLLGRCRTPRPDAKFPYRYEAFCEDWGVLAEQDDPEVVALRQHLAERGCDPEGQRAALAAMRAAAA